MSVGSVWLFNFRCYTFINPDFSKNCVPTTKKEKWNNKERKGRRDERRRREGGREEVLCLNQCKKLYRKLWSVGFQNFIFS
jgi:hypothetical protein